MDAKDKARLRREVIDVATQLFRAGDQDVAVDLLRAMDPQASYADVWRDLRTLAETPDYLSDAVGTPSTEDERVRWRKGVALRLELAEQAERDFDRHAEQAIRITAETPPGFITNLAKELYGPPRLVT